MTIEIFPRDQDNVNFRLKERLRLCRAWRLGLKYFNTSIFLEVGLGNISILQMFFEVGLKNISNK